ncbi:MAG TPA: ribonuclease HII, partial [Clostridiales bacterium UBA8153]|nr:ribonuclease HII [Clostridiales bacterium UBA8153]
MSWGCRSLPVDELRRRLASFPPAGETGPPDPVWRRVVACLAADSRPGVAKAARELGRRLDAALAEHHRLLDIYAPEHRLWRLGYRLVVGIDEAGRGPLAGPVVAAAVILAPGTMLPGLDDSKVLSSGQRERVCAAIKQQALAVGVASAGPRYIDRHNVLQATVYAMGAALSRTGLTPDHALIDAVKLPLAVPQWNLIQGDARSASIAAASVVAKVTRDRLMDALDRRFPEYGFS